MKSVWFKGFNEERKIEMKKEFVASSSLRIRLTELLNEKLVTSTSSLRAKVAYDNPSWAYQQADGIGYERAIYEIISLIAADSVDK
jgi:hypothetical protein